VERPTRSLANVAPDPPGSVASGGPAALLHITPARALTGAERCRAAVRAYGARGSGEDAAKAGRSGAGSRWAREGTLLGGLAVRPRTAPRPGYDGTDMQRLILTARLRDGAYQRSQTLAEMVRPDTGEGDCERLTVYLSPSEVVFPFEAGEPEPLVRRLLDDRGRAAALSPWLPLFDGPLHRADEVYRRSREEPVGASR